ncbi:hypothetical protein [Limosilactobacillus caviae]|jgi:hypothetical protein|uniref:Uncharacterized protein n=1 Tax=Limosilactobacillus caviae TaxID=1769424 RepID=A0ABQ2C788_9LACO|nr:hypothetical protein [Limosilactobacillus caviae]MCD7125148.1 hypothetical protein [Limosilactobacillus caviae]MRH47240.1 hypothetical protein [Limosilactobacillus reuteri]GGI64211.1 hypothetical protein GCM10011459_20450 [Limosilactobacillus caviae]
MSIFNGKDGWKKDVDKFVDENNLQDVDKEYDDALRKIAISKKLSGSAPILDRQSQYLTQYYQEMIEQNYILMRQNQEIINQLRKLNSK